MTKGECLPSVHPARYLCIKYPGSSPKSSPREVPQVDHSGHPGVVSSHTGTKESVSQIRYQAQLQKHASWPTTPTFYDKAATAVQPKLARLFGEGGQKQAWEGNDRTKRCLSHARRTNTPPKIGELGNGCTFGSRFQYAAVIISAHTLVHLGVRVCVCVCWCACVYLEGGSLLRSWTLERRVGKGSVG